MKKLKYCCNTFKEFCNAENEQIPAIRIIKMTSKQFLNKKTIQLWEYEILIPKNKIFRNEYRYYITLGYKKFSFFEVHWLPIWYCPFCGKRLDKLYKSDKYVHEIEGVTFNWKK